MRRKDKTYNQGYLADGVILGKEEGGRENENRKGKGARGGRRGTRGGKEKGKGGTGWGGGMERKVGGRRRTGRYLEWRNSLKKFFTL